MKNVRTVDLSDLIQKSDSELREAKEKLFRAIHNRNGLDYLSPNEQKLFAVLSESPSVKFSCRDILNKQS